MEDQGDAPATGRPPTEDPASARAKEDQGDAPATGRPPTEDPASARANALATHLEAVGQLEIEITRLEDQRYQAIRNFVLSLFIPSVLIILGVLAIIYQYSSWTIGTLLASSFILFIGIFIGFNEEFDK